MILEIATTALELAGGDLFPLAELAEGEMLLTDMELNQPLESLNPTDGDFALEGMHLTGEDEFTLEELSQNEEILSDRELNQPLDEHLSNTSPSVEDFKPNEDTSSLAELSKNEDTLSDSELNKSVEGYSKTLPRTGGEWTGEVGNSMWIPDKDYIPTDRNYSNPEGKTSSELFQKYGIDGIQFNNGEPDFSEISKGTVKIENFSDCRYGIGGNFDQADEKLAEERNCSKQEIKEWRKDNQYTWHERSDCQTMDLVPRDIHNGLPHSGGISVIKKTQ